MSEVTKAIITDETGVRLAQAIENLEQVAGPQGAQGVKGDPGPGFARGGTKDQVLLKNSANDYDTKWGDLDYNNLINKPNLLDLIYPVGSIYMSVNNVNPGGIFGGEWAALQDRFLVGAGNSYNGNATGGTTSSAHTHTVSPTGSVGNHTLTTSEMPSHTHGLSFITYGYGGWSTASVSGYTIPYSVGCNSDAGTSTQHVARTSFNGSIGSTGGGGAHNHPLTLNTVTSSGASATNNLPPYLAVYMWKRIA